MYFNILDLDEHYLNFKCNVLTEPNLGHCISEQFYASFILTLV